jgi:hypothetical protein
MLQICNQSQVFIAGLAKGAAGGGIPPLDECILLESDGTELLLESTPDCVLLES